MLKATPAPIEHCRALKGPDVVLKEIRQILSDVARGEVTILALKNPMEREIAVQHTVGACMSVLTWWLDRGGAEPPDKMDAMFNRLAIAGIGAGKLQRS